MREGSGGRHQVFPWGHALSALNHTDPGYAVGGNVYSGTCRGAVVSVDVANATMAVIWSDGDGGKIIYPMDATYLRKAMPWE